MSVVGSAFAVLLLVTTSLPLTSTPTSRPTASLAPLPSAFPAPVLPYLPNASQYPVASTVPNVTGTPSLTQVIRVSSPLVATWGLLYVDTDPLGNSWLMFTTGDYSPNLAQGLLTNSGCHPNCPPSVPIRWNAPQVVWEFGDVKVQSDSIASAGANVAIAASAQNMTYAWWSGVLGENGTWAALTGTQGAVGGDGRIALSGCAALLTTVATGIANTHAWWLGNSCLGGFGAQGDGPHGSPIRPQVTAPTVTGVSPACTVKNQVVTVTGTNFANPTTIIFNGTQVGATFVSSTKVTATVPTGTGWFDLRAKANGLTSAPNAPGDLFAFSPPNVCVNTVYPTSAAPGSLVYVNGSGFASGWTVSFGGAVAPQTNYISPTQLSAIVPSGCGSTTVTASFGSSSPVPLAPPYFTFLPGVPTVTAVSPTKGWNSTLVTVSGTNFCSGGTVKFGATASTVVTWRSLTQLAAVTPVGSGTVDITVKEGTHTSARSAADRFAYVPAPFPVVRNVTPSTGIAGSRVTIIGINFTPSAQVTFGGITATSVAYVTNSTLLAYAPAGGGVEDVRVTEYGATSQVSAQDHFTYLLPAVSRVYANIGINRSTVTIAGANFNSIAAAFFGTNATTTTYVSPTRLTAVVPRNWGTVNVTVQENGAVSNRSVYDEFTYRAAVPGSLSYNYTLTNAIDAAPVLFVGGAGVLLSQLTSHQVVFYRSGFGSSPFVQVGSLGNFSSTNSTSSPFARAGSTNTFVPGGIAGQVTVASEGTFLMAAFTSKVADRTGIQTATTTTSGSTWNTTFAAGAAWGSISNPEVVASPEGYFFATWLDGGNGYSQVDLASFSDDGHIIQNGSAVGVGGAAGVAASPSIGVDELERPLVVWTSASVNNTSASVEFTGAFLSPLQISQILTYGFESLQAPDFYSILGPNLRSWRAGVNGTLSLLRNDFAAGNLGATCAGERLFVSSVYTNLTQQLALPVFNATSPALCLPYPGIAYYPSNVSSQLGPAAPTLYLSIESQWLLESLGYGIMGEPTWWGAPNGPTVPIPPSGASPAHPSTSGRAVDNRGDFLSVHPLGVDPNAIFLNATGKYVSYTDAISTSACTSGPFAPGTITTVDYIVPSSYRLFVQETYQGPYGPYPSAGFAATYGQVPEIYLAYLSPSAWGGYTESVAAAYTATQNVTNTCTGVQTSQPVAVPSGYPSTTNLSAQGTWSTEFGFLPTAPPHITTFFPNPNNPNVVVSFADWNNSLEANATVTTAVGSSKTFQNVSSYRIEENLTLANVTIGPLQYTTTFRIQSQSGVVNSSWIPVLNAAQPGYPSTPLVQSAVCKFNMTANQGLIQWVGSGLTGITGTTATLTFYTQSAGYGFVDYREAFGTNESQSAVRTHLSSPPIGGYPYQYVVALHDLTPWGLYNAHVIAALSDGGCHTEIAFVTWTFQTQAGFQLSEEDQPYDSLTEAGGGGRWTWNVPLEFLQHGGQFVSGWVNITNLTSPSHDLNIQLNTSPLQATPGTFEYNYTGLELNTTYTATMYLNYSYANSTVFAVSYPFQFVYMKDTTGDGLTDWEKIHGWEVTTRDAWGATHNRWVTASPTAYATNGLVNDYLEKEFGLDPRTMDTAGSGMLDTWNLSFDLGANSSNAGAPSGVYTWNELGRYNYSTACAYPGQPTGQCTSLITRTIASEPSNLSDNSPWASRVLWSPKAFTEFERAVGNDSVDYLRGVLGNTTVTGSSGKVNERTLTLWGKLSWGANPLFQSTPLDGWADGQRINPLNTIQLSVSGLTASLGSSVCSAYTPGSGGSNGWAAQMTLNYTYAAGYSQVGEISNYSTPTAVSSSACGGISNYGVAIPVVNNVQYQHLDLHLSLNNSGTSVVNLPLGGSTTGSINFDMFGSTQAYSFSNSGDSLSVTLTPVVVGGKVPTWLFVPTHNGTLSPLPWGLKRYVGEQSFDLIVANVSQNVSLQSVTVPTPWGSTYSVSLPTGLNNILVPRTQWFNSSLGLGTLLGGNLADPLPSATPPILTSSDLGAIKFGNGTQPLENLSCYWQDMSVGANPSSPRCSGEKGTTVGSFGAVKILQDDQACSASNCGGIPSDPTAETSQNAGAALQVVMTLNVTSQTELDVLLAALLDNSSGGVNGYLQSVTGLIPSLGLAASVVAALANVTTASQGLFGVPTSVVPPPPPPSSGIWGAVWNAVSGLVTMAVGLVTALVSVAWSALKAIENFLNNAAAGLQKFAMAVASATVSALKTIGQALWNALQALYQYILAAAKALFSPLLSGFNAMVQAFYTLTNNSLTAAYNAFQGSGITSALATQIWQELGGPVFQLAITIGTIISIALALLQLISMGAGELLTILIGLIAAAILAALLPQSTNSLLSPAVVFLGEDAYNATTGLHPSFARLRTDATVCPGPGQAIFGTAAKVYGYLEGFLSSVYGAFQLKKAYGENDDPAFDVADVSFGFGLLAFAWGLMQDWSGICLPLIAGAGMALSAAGLIFDAWSFVHDKHKGANAVKSDLQKDIVVGLFDGAAFGLNVYAALNW